MNGEIKHIPRSNEELIGSLIVALSEHFDLYITKNTKYWVNIQYNTPESEGEWEKADDDRKTKA